MSDEKKKKKKGLLARAIDLVSNRDEKEAVEQAQKELEAANKAVEAAEEKADDRLSKANERIAKLEEEIRERRVQEFREKVAQRRAAAAAEKLAMMKEHTVKDGETLSHVALKYYGYATEPYWRVIFEANHDVMGDNEKRMYPGLVLKIPELPAALRSDEE
jgi:nucleoid-associated protein YgaU